MKRTIAMLLALTTLLCLFAACKGETQKNTPTDKKETGETTPPEEVLTDNLPEKDMDLFELRFYTNHPERFTWADTIIAPEAYTGEEIYDEMYDRNNYIEERFHCEITVTQGSPTALNSNTVIQNFALSGDSQANPHIVMHYDKWVLGSAQYFVDWNDVPYVSVGEEYWNPGVSDLFEIRGKQLALSGSFHLGMTSITMVLLFNKEMYEQYYGDISSMYGYVTSNEWTVDKLYELGFGVIDNTDMQWDATDQFGIDSPYKRLYTALMVGSDIRFVDKGEDGIPMFTLLSDSYAIEKMQKLLKLCQDYDIHYTNAPNVHDHDTLHSFENGRALFAVKALYDIPGVRASMDQEFGILPFPKYDTAQKEYRNISWAGELACMLNSVKEEDRENVGILMEALCFDSHQNLIPLYKDRLLKTRFASDEDSREMLDLIFKTTVCEIGANVFEDIVTVPIIEDVYMPKTDVLSSTLSGMSSVSNEIAKLLRNIK